MKTLYLIRHAKSDWSNQSLDDFDRPLNKRGKKNAPTMGKVLFYSGTHPDLILCSPALRAKTTAIEIAQQLSYPIESIIYENTLYAADVETILSIIRRVSDTVETLFVFGHNPEVTKCVNHICACDIGNIPTCGIVAVTLKNNTWASIGKNSAEILLFDYPKKHI